MAIGKRRRAHCNKDDIRFLNDFRQRGRKAQIHLLGKQIVKSSLRNRSLALFEQIDFPRIDIDAVVDRHAADGASGDGFGEGPAWSVPPVITYMIREAGLTPDEAYKTFNMGVGMSVICAEEDADDVAQKLADEGLSTFRMGKVVKGNAGEAGKVIYR